MKAIEVEGYTLEQRGEQVIVRHGKFTGELQELERTGSLTSPAGKVYRPAAWEVHKLANAAKALAAA